MYNKHSNPVTKDFAKILMRLLEERFPKCGSKNYLYAAATIVHPYYQGMALYDLDTHAPTTAQFVKDNEEQPQDDLNAAQVMDEFDEDDMSIEAATQRARAQRLGPQAAGVIRKLNMPVRSLANSIYTLNRNLLSTTEVCRIIYHIASLLSFYLRIRLQTLKDGASLPPICHLCN